MALAFTLRPQSDVRGRFACDHERFDGCRGLPRMSRGVDTVIRGTCEVCFAEVFKDDEEISHGGTGSTSSRSS